MAVPRDDAAARVEPGAELPRPGRAVVVVPHVVFARANHLHRCPDPFDTTAASAA